MIIRKTQQPSDYPSNSISNTKTTGTTNTYSCDYINGIIERNIQTAYLETNYTSTGTEWVTLPLKAFYSVGSKLSVQSDGGIKIGSGVSKVKVSGEVYLITKTTSGKFCRIVRNTIRRNSSVFYPASANSEAKMCMTSIVFPVSPNDIIYLQLSAAETDIVGANSTYLTVEVVE